MDVRGIVEHLKTLTCDVRNRATIVRDQGCLPGLVLFLDNADSGVVTTALEVSEGSPERREKMSWNGSPMPPVCCHSTLGVEKFIRMRREPKHYA